MENDTTKELKINIPESPFNVDDELVIYQDDSKEFDDPDEQLTDDELTYIAKQVSAIPSNKVGLSDVFKSAVYKKPSLVIDVLRVFAGV